MHGKDKCRMLREIRRSIAEQNDIALVTEECEFKGECKGTCPKCESELRYLEKELEKRKSLGKRVAVAGIAAGAALTLGGCDIVDAVDAVRTIDRIIHPAPIVQPVDIEMGEVEIDGEIEMMGDFPDENWCGDGE